MHSLSQARCHVVEVAIPPMDLRGTLTVPTQAAGTVVFARGGGQGSDQALNSSLARTLLDTGLATFVFDLLAPFEAKDQDNVLLLADRLDYAIGLVRSRPETAGLPVCLFGADEGAAAALVSAGSMPSLVGAVVCRTGRPDFATGMLGHVRAPTLYIVDGSDTRSLALNLAAKAMMICETGLTVLPRTVSHGADAPDAELRMARLAADWFNRHARKPREQGRRPAPICLVAERASSDDNYGRKFFARAKKA